jgi:hypothetical protein
MMDRSCFSIINYFSQEEKLIVPLISAPNGEYATKKTKRKGKKGGP